MSRISPDKVKICGVGRAPYVSVKIEPADPTFDGCVQMLKTYIEKSKETQ
jgi:hypothetical protein